MRQTNSSRGKLLPTKQKSPGKFSPWAKKNSNKKLMIKCNAQYAEKHMEKLNNETISTFTLVLFAGQLAERGWTNSNKENRARESEREVVNCINIEITTKCSHSIVAHAYNAPYSLTHSLTQSYAHSSRCWHIKWHRTISSTMKLHIVYISNEFSCDERMWMRRLFILFQTFVLYSLSLTKPNANVHSNGRR